MNEEDTVTAFLKETDLIKREIDKASSLVIKLSQELRDSRKCFELLRCWAPDNCLRITSPYHLKSALGDKVSMNEIINIKIKDISKILGEDWDEQNV